MLRLHDPGANRATSEVLSAYQAEVDTAGNYEEQVRAATIDAPRTKATNTAMGRDDVRDLRKGTVRRRVIDKTQRANPP